MQIFSKKIYFFSFSIFIYLITFCFIYFDFKQKSYLKISNLIEHIENDLKFMGRIPALRGSIALRTYSASREIFKNYLFPEKKGSFMYAIQSLHVFDLKKKEIVSFFSKEGSSITYSTLSTLAKSNDMTTRFTDEKFLFLSSYIDNDEYSITAGIDIGKFVSLSPGISDLKMAYWGELDPYFSFSHLIFYNLEIFIIFNFFFFLLNFNFYKKYF
jgi:hypothetical protein